MSIRNFTNNSVQPWKDVYCNEMNCDVMNVDQIDVDNAEVNNLIVNDSITGTAQIHNEYTLPDTTITFLEQGSNLQHMNVDGTAIGKTDGDIRTFHCACDATGVGGFPNQAYSGVQNTSTGDQTITLHVVDAMDNYSILQLCSEAPDSTSTTITPNSWSLQSSNIVLQGQTSIDDQNGASISCGTAPTVSPFNHGGQIHNINVNHETNIFAGTNTLYPAPIEDMSLITYRNLGDGSVSNIFASYDTGTNEPYANIQVSQAPDISLLNIRKDRIDFNTPSSTFQQTTMIFPGYQEGAMYIDATNNLTTIELSSGQVSTAMINVNRVSAMSSVDTYYQVVNNFVTCFSNCTFTIDAGVGLVECYFDIPVARNANFATVSDVHGQGMTVDQTFTALGVNIVVNARVGTETISLLFPGTATGSYVARFSYSYQLF